MSIGPKALLGRFGKTLKFALAGGTSALGEDLVEALLSRGHSIQIFSRTPKDNRALPYEELRKGSFDVVVNLIGGYSSNLSDQDVLEILAHSNHFLDVALEQSVPLVHLSSGVVLGPLEHPASNATPRFDGTFRTKYQELKIKLEQLHEKKRPSIDIADLRLFSFAGLNVLNKSDFFLSQLCRSVRDGIPIKLAGNDFLRDFTGPQELANAIEIAASTKFSGVANLFSERPASRSEVLKLFGEIFGAVVEDEEGNPGRDFYCADKELHLEQFNPRTSLDVIASESKRALAHHTL